MNCSSRFSNFRKWSVSASHLLTVVLTLVCLSPDPISTRRNSKFARHWEKLDRLQPKTTIKRHIVQRTR